MNAQQEETAAIIGELIETCRDGQEGFRLAAEAVTDDVELKRLLSSFSLQRAKFAGELEGLLTRLGHEIPADHLSAGGTAHRGWMKIKSALSLHDPHAILAECERGEDVAKEAYARAVAQRLSEPAQEIVRRQRQEVLATHNTIRALRDSTEPGSPLAATTEAASEAWESAKEKGHALHAAAKERIRERPVPAILALLAAGFAFGLAIHLLRRRNEPTDPLERANLATTQWFGKMGRKLRRERAMHNIRRKVNRLANRHLPDRMRWG